MELPEKFCVMPIKEKKNDKQPDYRVVTTGSWVEIAACWKKLDKNGKTFLSCMASKPRPDFQQEEQQANETMDSL